MPRKRPLGERFDRAMVYAARAHSTQFRKGTRRPYVGHLLGVASIVLAHGGDEDEAIAALLHDAVEDQGGKPRLLDIRQKFGLRVAQIVEGSTDSRHAPEAALARTQAGLSSPPAEREFFGAVSLGSR